MDLAEIKSDFKDCNGLSYVRCAWLIAEVERLTQDAARLKRRDSVIAANMQLASDNSHLRAALSRANAEVERLTAENIRISTDLDATTYDRDGSVKFIRTLEKDRDGSYRRGRESMREEAAKVATYTAIGPYCECWAGCDHCKEWPTVDAAIRAIPTEAVQS